MDCLRASGESSTTCASLNLLALNRASPGGGKPCTCPLEINSFRPSVSRPPRGRANARLPCRLAGVQATLGNPYPKPAAGEREKLLLRPVRNPKGRLILVSIAA